MLSPGARLQPFDTRDVGHAYAVRVDVARIREEHERLMGEQADVAMRRCCNVNKLRHVPCLQLTCHRLSTIHRAQHLALLAARAAVGYIIINPTLVIIAGVTVATAVRATSSMTKSTSPSGTARSRRPTGMMATTTTAVQGR